LPGEKGREDLDFAEGGGFAATNRSLVCETRKGRAVEKKKRLPPLTCDEKEGSVFFCANPVRGEPLFSFRSGGMDSVSICRGKEGADYSRP